MPSTIGPWASGEHVAEVIADGFFELLVTAGLRIAVGPPALELRGVPEPASLHVVVADLEDALWPQRHEREVLALAPPALGAGDAVGVGHEARARPRPLAP